MHNQSTKSCFSAKEGDKFYFGRNRNNKQDCTWRCYLPDLMSDGFNACLLRYVCMDFLIRAQELKALCIEQKVACLPAGLW